MKIVRYTPFFKNQVLGLLKFLWNDRSFEDRKSLLEWKYERSPYFSNLMFIALEDEKVIGFRGYTINKTIFENRVFYTACLADAVTSPSSRGKGIFNKLTKFSLEALSKIDINVVLALSSNNFSTPGYIKLGFNKLIDREPLFRVSLYGILTNFFKFKDTSINYLKIKNDLTFKITDKLNFSVSHFEMLSKKQILSKSATTLKPHLWYDWKYSNPSKKYIFCSCWKKNELVDFIILNKNHRYWTVVDYSYTNHVNFNLLLKSVFNRLNPHVIMLMETYLDKNMIDVFKKRKFYKYKFLTKIFNKKFEPILVKFGEIVLKKESNLIDNLKIPSNWNIRFSDSDAS